jgi:hypothetical protein
MSCLEVEKKVLVFLLMILTVQTTHAQFRCRMNVMGKDCVALVGDVGNDLWFQSLVSEVYGKFDLVVRCGKRLR